MQLPSKDLLNPRPKQVKDAILKMTLGWYLYQEDVKLPSPSSQSPEIRETTKRVWHLPKRLRSSTVKMNTQAFSYPIKIKYQEQTLFMVMQSKTTFLCVFLLPTNMDRKWTKSGQVLSGQRQLASLIMTKL